MRYLISGSQTLFDNEHYKIISVEEALSILKSRKVWGLDTETYGLDPYTKPAFSLQLGDFEDQFVFDLSTVDIAILKDFLEDPGVLFVLQNAKFDLQVLYHKRIVLKNVFDTFLAEKLLWLGYPGGFHRMGLADIAKEYLNVELDKSIRGALHYEGLSDRVIIYGAEDVKYLIPIMEIQKRLLKEKELLTAIDIENRFVRVIAYMEYSGLYMNPDKWRAKMERDQNLLQDALDKLNNWVLNHGDTRFIYQPEPDLFEPIKAPVCKLNWNSSTQLIPFFESLGFDLWTTDKDTGELKKSVDMDIIEAQGDKSDIVGPYVQYSKAFKVITTWGQNWIDAINPVSGRIHTNFNQLMDTTRLSSGGKDKKAGVEYLNFQNIPSDEETRACFEGQGDNWLCASDYSAQEDLVFTEMSRESKLIEFYNDTTRKRDGHSFTAKLTFQKELDGIEEEDIKKVRPDLRKKAKSAKFAIHYGGNGLTISRNLGLPEDEGNRIAKGYLVAFPDIDRYFKVVKKEAWSRGYVLINPKTGHRAHIYDWDQLIRAERLIYDRERGFWDDYKNHKNLYNRTAEWQGVKPKVKNVIVRMIFEEFSKGTSIGTLANQVWTYHEKNNGRVTKVWDIKVSKPAIYVEIVKHYFKRKGSSERMALNYPIQGTSSQITKIAAIKYFKHLEEDGLLFTVWIPNMVHDEIITEAPESMIHREAELLQKAMEDAGKIFVEVVTLKAVPEVAKHWVH